MAMVHACFTGCQYRRAEASWLGPKVGGHLPPFLYSSHELSELSQSLFYDDSTVNIIVIIIINSNS